MNRMTLSLLAACAIATPAFAGETIVTAKDYKQPVALPSPCFRDQELQLDLFYSYNDGRPASNQYFRDGSGGGIGVNYFFSRYFGFSVEGNWWNGTESRSGTERVKATERVQTEVGWREKTTYKNRKKASDRSVAHQVTGNFIIRYPIELNNLCFAPYIFGGGGGLFDGSKVGFADAGAGVEWRATEHFGVFADWRWNFTGKSKNDIDTTRAGVRFVF